MCSFAPWGWHAIARYCLLILWSGAQWADSNTQATPRHCQEHIDNPSRASLGLSSQILYTKGVCGSWVTIRVLLDTYGHYTMGIELPHRANYERHYANKGVASYAPADPLVLHLPDSKGSGQSEVRIVTVAP